MPRHKSIKKSLPRKFNYDSTNLLLQSLTKFFMNNENYLIIIQDILSGDKLKIIDFLLNDYCNKNKIIINHNDNIFLLKAEYKNQLKTYAKKHFDINNKTKKFDFIYKDINISTSISQLNLLKWIVTAGIYDYIQENYIFLEKKYNNKINN